MYNLQCDLCAWLQMHASHLSFHPTAWQWSTRIDSRRHGTLVVNCSGARLTTILPSHIGRNGHPIPKRGQWFNERFPQWQYLWESVAELDDDSEIVATVPTKTACARSCACTRAGLRMRQVIHGLWSAIIDAVFQMSSINLTSARGRAT